MKICGTPYNKNEHSRIFIYILEYTFHILRVNIVLTSFLKGFDRKKRKNSLPLKKIASNITKTEKSYREKPNKNMKRLWESYADL